MPDSESTVYATVENLFSASVSPSAAQHSELSECLRTNSVPVDLSYIRSVIAASRLELARYNTNICTISAALEGAISERDAFQLHSERCHSLLAPIRALPREILLHIFTFCSEPWQSRTDFALWSQITPRDHMEQLARPDLLRLSRVCSSWRTAILGTPSLWAPIQVNLSEWLLPPIARRLTYLLTAAVKRAGACPLKLKLRTTGQAYEVPSLELLAHCSARWQSLNLWINFGAFRHLSSTRGNLAFLEKLEIHGDLLHELDIFEDAPRLVEVTLRRSGSSQPPLLPWHQLHTLNYENGNAAELGAFMSLIRQCPNLHAVTFTALDVSGLPNPLILEPLELKLESLSIIFRNTRNSSVGSVIGVLSAMLNSFTLPCAKQLSFRMNSLTPLIWAHRTFLAFLSRSSCSQTVTSLALHGIKFARHGLFECMAALPQLEILSLSDYPPITDQPMFHLFAFLDTDELLEQLTWTPDAAACLVPRLRVFHFTTLFRFSSQMMLKLAASRAEAQAGRIEGLGGVRRFELRLGWHQTPEQPPPILDSALISELDAMQRRGDIWYSLTASD